MTIVDGVSSILKLEEEFLSQIVVDGREILSYCELFKDCSPVSSTELSAISEVDIVPKSVHRLVSNTIPSVSISSHICVDISVCGRVVVLVGVDE